MADLPRKRRLLSGTLVLVVWLAGASGLRAEDAASPAPQRQPRPRAQTALETSGFGEGWKQTIPSPQGTDTYTLSVQNGWLHVKRANARGDLDWEIVLARFDKAQPPQVLTIPGAPVFEVSCADGRYFIRETMHALRCFRQRKGSDEYVPRTAILGDGYNDRGWGSARPPQLTLSAWDGKEWFFVASGRDAEQVDAVVRLNPVAKRSPGHGVQSIVGGFCYYFHGDMWLMDDGELLVAFRTLESDYEAVLAQEKIRKNLTNGAPPALDVASWLNTSGELSWDTLKGKVVLLDFWGTWCGPCVKKLPDVQALADRYADRGLVVIGMHSDQGGETCAEFVQEKKISYPIAIDSGKTAAAFAISAWPTVFLIDKSGKVVSGYTSELPEDAVIDELLKQ